MQLSRGLSYRLETNYVLRCTEVQHRVIDVQGVVSQVTRFAPPGSDKGRCELVRAPALNEMRLFCHRQRTGGDLDHSVNIAQLTRIGAEQGELDYPAEL